MNSLRIGCAVFSVGLALWGFPPVRAAESGPDEAFGLQMKAAVERRDAIFQAEGAPAAIAQYIADLEKLMVEFPARSEPYEGLFSIALSCPDAQARPMFERVMQAPPASENLRDAARAQIARLDLVGKPLELKFTSFDGRPVDLAKMRGKVVLIDFWATWCGPCMHDLPAFKETVNKFKDRGVEIIGVNLDKDSAKLAAMVQEQNMFWPQAFDGKMWEGDVVTRFGVRSIPSVWLVDQQGVLRDTFGRQDLTGKLEAMLKERPAGQKSTTKETKKSKDEASRAKIAKPAKGSENQ